MADIKISALPAATAPAGTEEIPLVQGGVTKKATVSQLLGGGESQYVDATGDTMTGPLAINAASETGFVTALRTEATAHSDAGATGFRAEAISTATTPAAVTGFETGVQVYGAGGYATNMLINSPTGPAEGQLAEATGIDIQDQKQTNVQQGYAIRQRGTGDSNYFAGIVEAVGNIAVGTNPATSGQVRLPSGSQIKWRNAANSADGGAIYFDPGDHMSYASPGWHRFISAGTEIFTVRANGIICTQPITGAPWISVGTSPAQVGAIRLPNNQRISWRNSVNNADEGVIALGSDNILRVGSSATTVMLYSGASMFSVDATGASASVALRVGTSPAATGIIRLPNNQQITARTASNDADIALLHLSASNNVVVGGTANNVYVGAANSNTFISTLSLGASPALSGAVRMPNNQGILARNAANTADYRLIASNASDQIIVGQGTAGATQLASALIGFFGATPIAKPTGTPAAATDPASTMALVNSLRASLIALGLIS